MSLLGSESKRSRLTLLALLTRTRLDMMHDDAFVRAAVCRLPFAVDICGAERAESQVE